jgi:hypothetical protein
VGMVRAWIGRPTGFEFIFIGFGFQATSAWLATGPRRFPPPNHATGFEIFLGGADAGKRSVDLLGQAPSGAEYL